MNNIKCIHVGFLTGNLIQENGIDEGASARKYAEMIENALRKSFKNCEIEIDWQNASGALPEPLRTRITTMDNEIFFDNGVDPWHSVIQDVEEICGRVWQDGGWIVEETEDES